MLHLPVQRAADAVPAPIATAKIATNAMGRTPWVVM